MRCAAPPRPPRVALRSIATALAAALMASSAAAAPDGSSGRSPTTYRLVVLPYWNTSDSSLDALGPAIAKAMLASPGKLAANDRLVPVPPEQLEQAMQEKLTASEREAYEGSTKHGNPGAAVPLLAGIAKAADADLLIVGTFQKAAATSAALGQVTVDSWLFVRPKAGPLEDPVRHEFKATYPGNVTDFARQVSQDEWWEASDEARWFTKLGTLHPNAAQLKFLDLGTKTKEDRIKLAQSVFPEEFLHSKTCEIKPEQMRDVTLATQQMVGTEDRPGIEWKNPRAHNYRGLVEFCGSNTPQALRYFEKATSIDPTFPDPWYNAGTIYWDSYQAGHSKDDLEKAFQAFSKAVENDKGFAEARAKRGLAWLAKGEPNKADADLTAAYREDRRNPDVLLGRCQLAVAAKQDSQASGFCGDAVRVDPGLADAHAILGDIARDDGMVTTAVDHYRKAIKAKPDLADARIHLIEMLFQNKRYAEAREAANAMVAAAPTHSVPHYWLGKICEEGDQDYLCAEQQYAKAFELGRDWVTLRDDISRARKKRGPNAEPAPPLGDAPPAAAPKQAAGPSQPTSSKPVKPSTGPRSAPVDKDEFLRKYNATKGSGG